METPVKMNAIMERLHNYRRILQVARKPSKDEFTEIAKVCAAGMGIVGIVGFAMYIMSKLLIG